MSEQKAEKELFNPFHFCLKQFTLQEEHLHGSIIKLCVFYGQYSENSLASSKYNISY